MTRTQQADERCEACRGALQRSQRYCLACGARVGARDPLLQGLLEHLYASARAAPPAPADAEAPARARAAVLPSLRIWAPLTLAFLGFGVLLGDAASSSVQSTLAAASRQPLKLVLPSATPAEGASTTGSPPAAPGASAAASEAAASEAPSAEGEASSSPAASTPAAPAAHQKTAAGTTSSPPSPSRAESQSPQSSPGSSAGKLPAVKHVFVITLSDQPYAAVFGPASAAPYLAHTLERRGELLVRYYAVAHEQLANEIALLSGQGPTPQTAANCPTYINVTAAEASQAGNGCVYPRATQTLAAQLAARHLTWRAYVEGLDEGGRGACAHPALGEADASAGQPPPGAYATFRNPFVYFHSIIDWKTCQSEDVALGKLTPDLSRAARTATFSYIAPDRCHDGSPTPCAPGAAAGLPAADTFLRQVVPKILASKAYKEGGLLVITVDQAPSSGELADSSSCCGQPRFPSLPSGASPAGVAAGGGQVGALLLSPFVKPGSTSQEPYNHFSLLRTFEDLFGLAHLAYAGGAHVTALEPSLFSAKGR